MEVILKLTMEQAESLSDILWDYQDEGPLAGGWASNELEKFRAMIDDAIESAKTKKA